MFSVSKPSRRLLYLAIKNYAHYIKGDILDVGCGGKDRYSDLFAKNKYIRMDNNPDFKPDIVGDAQQIPLPDAGFDSVFCTQTLEHLAQPQKAVNEFFRVLKNNGYCLITAPHFNELHEEPHDFWRFTKYSLEMIFKDAGFRKIEVKPLGGYYSTLANLIVRRFIYKYRTKKIPKIILTPPLNVFSRTLIFLDRKNQGEIGEKFALGWLVLAQKQRSNGAKPALQELHKSN